MADDYAEHSAANPSPDDLDYAEHSASNPPPDDLNSPARQALRDSLVETITRLPTPAAGRYVLEEGKGILRPALRWQYADGTERQNQLVPPEYLLMMGDQEYATWLPQGWTLNVFPIGLTLPHLECWLNWGETTIAVEEQGDISPSTDRSSLALATPRRLVTHAYLLVHHLGLPDPPDQPRQPMDLAGCLAELRAVRAFIRRHWPPVEQSNLARTTPAQSPQQENVTPAQVPPVPSDLSPSPEGTPTTPPVENEKEPNLEQRMERFAQVIGDKNAALIMELLNKKDLSGEEKMKEILKLDRRFTGKKSTDWAVILNVSDAAVRGYATWKTLQKPTND
jgi:hypothetical protein